MKQFAMYADCANAAELYDALTEMAAYVRTNAATVEAMDIDQTNETYTAQLDRIA